MNLYRISQVQNTDYDTYDSAVVAAETEEQARMTHPGWSGSTPWNGSGERYGDWANANHVSVELIGTAVEGTEPGVICASYNAG